MSRLATVMIVSSMSWLLLAGGAARAASQPANLGAVASGTIHTYAGYYDGHKDTYVVTDVSSKAQAVALKINYSPPLALYRGAPAQYFIQGKAVPGQLAVFGSEPGEADYNPLWEELTVTWKPGVMPLLLRSDNQINALAKKGELTVRDAHVVLNAPITSVGK